MSKSVIETLKELVKANGNQAAAILDAVIQALEQGGGGSIVVPGQNGDVLLSDGNGGVATDSKLHYGLADGGNYKLLSVDGVIAATREVDSLGDVNATYNVNADGSVWAKLNVNAGGKVLSHDDVFIGDKDRASGIYMHDTTDPTAQYYVTITNGQLTATLIQ